MEVFDNKVYNDMEGMIKRPSLIIVTNEFVSVSVVNQSGVEYKNGSSVSKDDVLTITATITNDNYELKTLKVNGNDFINGEEHNVSKAVYIKAISQGKAYDLSRTETNGAVAVARNGNVVLDGEGVVRYGEELAILAISSYGYEKLSFTVNGEPFESGDIFVVGAENVVIIFTNKIIEYNITYELNDGQNSVNNPLTYTVETETITLENATKDYYSFGGWYTNGDFTSELVTQIEKGTFGDISLFAKFTPNTYTITYMDGDNEIENLEPSTYVYGQETNLPVAIKEGYNFNGWYETSDFSGDVIETISVEDSGNKTYYASFSNV